jgi:hypothetical protein
MICMSFDISQLLEEWDYQPGQPSVRKFIGKDGQEKIQLRVDLGVLQMNAEGRPDGKRPLGHASLYEHYQAKLYRHLAANQGNEDGFKLTPSDCVKLQLEAFQYHNRYNCQLQLKDFSAVVRDTERNLAVLDFDQVYTYRPLSRRQKLEKDLNEAVNNEDYEKAAQVRDELKSLKATE